MNKNFLIVLLVILGYFFILMIDDSLVCIEENCFEVEIAENLEEKSRGLMYVESLSEREGMLFLYESSGSHSFWMKNTFISLDIIWINNNEVVYIEHSGQPCGEVCIPINPGVLADNVLEIRGGLSKHLGIEIGDKVSFNL